MCQKDGSLLARVEALLASHRTDSFLEAPAIDTPRTAVMPAAVSEGPGTMIDRYKLLQRVGEGGFGVVFMAEQREPVKRAVLPCCWRLAIQVATNAGIAPRIQM